MTHPNGIWFSLLTLSACVLPIQGGDLKNPGFEEAGNWQIIRKGDALQGAFDDSVSQNGKKCFTVSLANGTATKKEDFAGITQVLELTQADRGISFYVKDDYTGGTKGYHWMELLLDQEVIWESDVIVTKEEGCLSLPDHYAEVERPETVKIRYLDRQNEIREMDADGMLATCVQHEIDHLDGVLFVDHVSALKRNMILRKLTKAKRQGVLETA